jgi:hypothetical protein
MKAHESPIIREELILELEPEINTSFPFKLEEKTEVSLLAGTIEEEFLLQSLSGNHPPEPVRGIDTGNQGVLQEIINARHPHLSWVLSTRPKGKIKPNRVVLAVRPFASEVPMSEVLEIGVDDKIVDDLEQKMGKSISSDIALKVLTDDILINYDYKSSLKRAILSDSPPSDKKYRRGGFRMFGKRYALDVAVPLGSERMQKLEVIRLIRLPKIDPQKHAGATLLNAPLSFKDVTVAQSIDEKGEAKFREIADKAGSSLKLWREYNKLEKESIIKKARQFGHYKYDKWQKEPDGTYLFKITKEFPPEIDFDIDSLVASDNIPSHLEENAEISEFGKGRKSGPVFYGKYMYCDPKRDYTLVAVRPPLNTDYPIPKPPSKGKLYLSTRGEEISLERREQAEALIRDRRNPMPILMLLLQGEEFPIKRFPTIKPLSDEVRKSIGGEPTKRQIKALDIALNTPDIALIQGPPGTGKTRVIAALEKRLAANNPNNGQAGSARTLPGSILVTSYQQDAVANVATASEVFGLPAIKVGGRQYEREELDGFEMWRLQRVQEVEAKLSQSETPVAIALRQCSALAISYMESPPNPDQLKRMVKNILEFASPYVEAVLLDELQELLTNNCHRSFAGESDMERDLALKAVRGLRSDNVSFPDDGPYQARKALVRCSQVEGILSKAERLLLEKAADWEDKDELDFLCELDALKSKLTESLLPARDFSEKLASNPDIEAKINAIVDSLSRCKNSDHAGAEQVLFDYHDDLKNDREGTRRAVERYSVVLAATCQQSVGYEMGKSKFGKEIFDLKPEIVPFETVVVDEAARANPLDLLIPMSLAKRRIILVGDHRQLPHMLEPEIEKQIALGQPEESKDVLRQSLFQKLFEEMQVRENKDKFKRTVTLNVQYRMHPVLGSFVSDNFYKQYGEGFESGKPAEEFDHGLSRYGQAVATWVNIPSRKGQESGRISKKRSCEAKWIAKEAHSILTERPDLSVGIISFYSMQVKELNREMEKFGLTEPVEFTDSFRPPKDYEFTEDATGKIRERLRVGTVDAFQGKEFDVVILSMTRSNSYPSEEKTLRRKYGHLVLDNRLCVAMSRQQRLLIVVGDPAMLEGEIAAKHISGLVNFKELCGGEHGHEI